MNKKWYFRLPESSSIQHRSLYLYNIHLYIPSHLPTWAVYWEVSVLIFFPFYKQLLSIFNDVLLCSGHEVKWDNQERAFSLVSIIATRICLTTKIYKDFYLCYLILIISSVQFSHSVVSDSLQPHEPQHTRPPCPSPTPAVHPNSCPSSRWCHPAISSSVVPFSSCLQSFQHQGLFKWVSSSHQVPKILEFQLQHQNSSHFWVPDLSRTP